MRPLTRLRNDLSLSSIGATFTQPAFWSVPQMLGSNILGDRERIGNNFDGYVAGAFKANGIVFTTILIRMFTLAEARFQYQQIEDGRPGELADGPGLSLLENPWPNGTTGELIGRMEQDGSLAGNFFATEMREGAERWIRRLRPDWVTIVTESPKRPDGSPGHPWDLGARVSSYIYTPRTSSGGLDPDGAVVLTPNRVVHWSPIPDPAAQWRGMSWVTSIVREVEADNAASKHKLKFFENNATGNMAITYDKGTPREEIETYAALFAEQHGGTRNAYKTFHFGGGADAKMLSADMKQLDFKVTQGAGESRIAAASLVGAVVAQLSEGMQGSSLNAGNFGQALRRWSDIGARPLWRSMAASLAKFAPPPDGARLWYDDRDIPFLQQDAKDAAEINHVNAQAIAALARDGWEPDAAVAAITSGDMAGLIGNHTGLPSVQVQPPDGSSARATVSIRQVASLLADGWTIVPEGE